MLPIYLEITDEAKKIINKNIGYMFGFLKDISKGLSYEEVLDDIYPHYILDIRIDKCIQTIKELYNMALDNYEREYLEPFYEWTLYFTIVWWKEIAEDIELDEVPREYCIDEYEIDMYEYLNNTDNYFDFLFQDWDFLELEMIYSIYKKAPKVLTGILGIDIEDYLELMPNDIIKNYKKMKEKAERSMDRKNNIILNINGGQVNISKDKSSLNAIQNNGVNGDELENLITEIMKNLNGLDKEITEEIIDMLDLVKTELSKPEPKQSRLKNCLTLIAPMFTITNGIPKLYENLAKLQDFIMKFISI